jgi:hypothetical protein
VTGEAAGTFRGADSEGKVHAFEGVWVRVPGETPG